MMKDEVTAELYRLLVMKPTRYLFNVPREMLADAYETITGTAFVEPKVPKPPRRVAPEQVVDAYPEEL